MNEIDLRSDPQRHQPFETLIGKGPVPSLRLRLNSVPRHTVPGGSNTEGGEQLEVLGPPLVMAREFVLIEGSSGGRMRFGDKRILDTRHPPESLRRGKVCKLRLGREFRHYLILRRPV